MKNTEIPLRDKYMNSDFPNVYLYMFKDQFTHDVCLFVVLLVVICVEPFRKMIA